MNRERFAGDRKDMDIDIADRLSPGCTFPTRLCCLPTENLALPSSFSQRRAASPVAPTLASPHARGSPSHPAVSGPPDDAFLFTQPLRHADPRQGARAPARSHPSPPPPPPTTTPTFSARGGFMAATRRRRRHSTRAAGDQSAGRRILPAGPTRKGWATRPPRYFLSHADGATHRRSRRASSCGAGAVGRYGNGSSDGSGAGGGPAPSPDRGGTPP